MNAECRNFIRVLLTRNSDFHSIFKLVLLQNVESFCSSPFFISSSVLVTQGFFNIAFIKDIT